MRRNAVEFSIFGYRTTFNVKVQAKIEHDKRMSSYLNQALAEAFLRINI